MPVITWDATFETLPPDNEARSLGALRIRDLKLAISERIVIDHQWTDATHGGKHNHVTLRPKASTAAMVLSADDGRIFTAPVSGVNELCYQNSAGTVTRITSGSGLNITPVIPAGARLVFMQASPPSGWTFISGVEDRTILLAANGGGGVTGGAWGLTGLSVGGHPLSVAELPPHSHTQVFGQNIGGPHTSWSIAGTGPDRVISTLQTESTGSGAAHSHTFHSDGTWRPPYLTGILCEKT